MLVVYIFLSEGHTHMTYDALRRTSRLCLSGQRFFYNRDKQVSAWMPRERDMKPSNMSNMVPVVMC